MATLVNLPQGKRFKLPRRGIKFHWTSLEASPAIAVINVDSPALEGRDDAQMTVAIELPYNDGPTRHAGSRSPLGKGCLEFPVARPIAEINLDAGFLKSKQD